MTYALALEHHLAGRLAEAEALYRQVLAENGTHTDSLHMLGVLAAQVGRADIAAELIGQAIGLKGDVASYHNNLGNVLKMLGRFDEAVAHFERALALHPAYAEAHGNLGTVRQDQGRIEEAVVHYRQALALQPDYADAHNNLGAALVGLGRSDEALSHCERAIALGAAFATAHFNAGNACKSLGRLDEAIAHYRQAATLRPDHAGSRNNLGSVLKVLGRLDEAVAAYRRAVALAPEDADMRNNLGTALQEQGRLDQAAAHYQQALAIDPTLAEAHWNRGFLRLLSGDLAGGWPGYEWRWRWRDAPAHGPPSPAWDGGALDGRTIVLHCEQGMGDGIQFVRYVPMVRDRGGHVLLRCPAPLVRLFAGVDGAGRIVAEGDPLPGGDCHAALLSLPGLFGTTLDTIPTAVPYLRPDPALIGAWRDRLAECRGLKVGVVWRGSPTHARDRGRSIPAALFGRCLDVPGITVVSLQQNAGADEISALGITGPLVDAGGALTDFAETAAVIANLDMVISVDTSVCHLAGAVGAPVWTLVPFAPDWRWLLEREDSPWYPTMRLIRQPKPGDWPSVMDRVRRYLGSRASGPSPRSAFTAAAITEY